MHIKRYYNIKCQDFQVFFSPDILFDKKSERLRFYRDVHRQIGSVLADFNREGGNVRFRDDQRVKLAGVISHVKTKATKNNSLMAYITLDDGTGTMELLAFQRVLDSGGSYVREGLPVMVTGRLSARDDKDPQLVAETIRPLSDADPLPDARKAEERKLYVRIPSQSDPRCERLKLVLTMFPGSDRLILCFDDTKKRLGARCVIHDARIKELGEMFGEENVVLK